MINCFILYVYKRDKNYSLDSNTNVETNSYGILFSQWQGYFHKIIKGYSLYLLLILSFTHQYNQITHEKWLLEKIYYKKVSATLIVESDNTYDSSSKINASLLRRDDACKKEIAVKKTCDLGNNISSRVIKTRIYSLYYKDREIRLYHTGLKLYIKAPFQDLLNKQAYQTGTSIKIDTILKPEQLLHNFVDNTFFNNISSLGYRMHINIKPVTLSLNDIRYLSKPTLYNAGKLRFQVIHAFTDLISSLTHRGLINALLFGDKSLISSYEKKFFTDTGTAHLIAISGMHITLVFALFVKAFSFLYHPIIYNKYGLSKQRFTRVLSWLIVLLYVYLSGFNIPAARAFYTISVLLIIDFLKIKISILAVFLFVLLCQVLIDPLSLYSISFWLSYVATFYLVYLGINYSSISLIHNNEQIPLYKKYLDEFYCGFIACSRMFFCLAPITFLFFNLISIFSLLANIIAIPVISIFVLPVAVSCLIIFILILLINFICIHGQISLNIILWIIEKVKFFLLNILSFIDYILDKLLIYLSWVAEINYNQFFYYFDSINYLIIFILSIKLFTPKGIPVRSCNVILVVILIFNIRNNYDNFTSSLSIDVLDVGQGLSVLVNTKHHQLLYDTGPKLQGDYLANNILIKTIKSFGKHLDTVVLSHWDSDHSGNLDALLKSITVNEFISSNNYKNKYYEESYNMSTSDCDSNSIWYFDGIKFSLFNAYEPNQYFGNNSSCVLHIDTGNIKILLTGDIELKSETKLLNKFGNDLRSDILLVPHHGSKTSSSCNFIKQVEPKYALISVGKENIYHLPNSEVIERYKKFGVKLIRTDVHGGVRILIKDQNITLLTNKKGI